MKFISITFLAICIVSASVLADPANIVDVTINSAQLNQNANVFMKIYGINSATPIALPINTSTLNDSTYVEFSTPVQNGTQAPTWSNTYGFSNYFFSTNSYVAFELWNQTYDSTNDINYLGGAQFTIQQLQAFPQTNNIVLTNPSGLSPGYLNIAVQPQ